MAIKAPIIDSNDFACVCTPGGREEIRLVREWALERLTGTGDLLGQIVVALAFDYSAEITGIHVDQWFGITASTHDNEFKVFMQCDNPEDGFIYIYKAFYDHFGPEGYEYDIEKAKSEREKGR